MILVATVVALAWANSPRHGAYESVRGYQVGPAVLRLHLPLTDWGGDGLLAVFFFVAGLELKRELTVGSLRRPAEALLPIGSALLGMAVSALIYLFFTRGDPDAGRGWAIPTATDIAFCLAIPAIVGQALPSALRAFLLTLAVVDDLVAIIIIGLFYASDLEPRLLGCGLVPLLAYAGLATGVDTWVLLLPPALLALGLLTRVDAAERADQGSSGAVPTLVAAPVRGSCRAAVRVAQRRHRRLG